MARIPVPDVTDLGDASPAKLRAAGFDMGPGNPRVGPSGSAQAESFRAQQAANMGPQQPAGMRQAAPPVNGMGYDPNSAVFKAGQATAAKAGEVGKVAGTAIRSAGAATGKFIAGNANPILSGIAQTAGHGDIYFDEKVPVMDRIRVGANDLLGAAGGVVGGTFGAGLGSAVPVAGTVAGGLAGGVAGLRAGNWLGNKIFGADEVMRRNGYDPDRNLLDVAFDGVNGKGMFGGEQAQFNRDIVAPGAGPQTTATPTTARQTPVVAPATTNPREPFSDARYASQNPALLAGTTDSQVIRNGNSFSGGNIKEGFPYGGAGRPVGLTEEQGGGGLKGGGTVTTMPTIGVDGYQRQLANIRGLGPAPDSTLGQGAGGIGFTPGGASQAPSVDTRGMSQRQIAGLRMQEASLAEQRRSSDQAAGVQMAGINTSAGVATRGQDIGASTSIRGQDMTFAANKANNRFQAQKFDLERGDRLREFDAGRSDAKFNQQQQTAKNLQDQIASWIPPTMQDGKQAPDTQTAARYSVAVQTAVGRMGKTLADLNDADKGRLIQGMQLADVASGTATNGVTPWGTKAIVSNEPILGLQKLPNGDYRTNRLGVNGEQEIIPARYVEKEGSMFGMQYFGKSSNRFAGLIQGEAK